MSEDRRVVITGMGWVTPLGYELESVWAKLLAGASGIGPIRRFDASGFPTTFAGEVDDGFDCRGAVQRPELHENVGRNIGFALGAAMQAWRSAGLDRLDAEGELDLDRLGLYLGSGEGPVDFGPYAAALLAGWDPETQRVDAAEWAAAARQNMAGYAELAEEPNMPLTHLALELGARGPAHNCLTACAASTQAIGEASEILRRGAAEVMVTGGTHTMIHPLGVTGFNRLTALSQRNDDPAHASRPFSRDRDGFVMGEGAGMLVLETMDHARRRGAQPLAEVAGYGSSADAYRITDIQPDGRGAADAMRQAIAMSGVEAEQVGYISAHGTGTRENDAIETRAVKAVFGDRAANVPMSSIKSMLGHLIAAAGAVEAIACVLAMRDQKLPPTMNLNDPDPELDLDYVPNAARDTGDRPVDVCLSNSFGFGGQNDSLVLRRIRD